jgi:hypothetical protein
LADAVNPFFIAYKDYEVRRNHYPATQ